MYKRQIENGLPVFGTCAGMILLAKEIENSPVTHLATMDITVIRNAYGRQLGSFETVETFHNQQIPMIFIRAPYISKTTGKAEVLATAEGKIVAARQGRQLVTAFHPELSNDLTVHSYFLKLIQS